MEALPKVPVRQFVESMELETQAMLEDVMQAVNQAPDGDWIGGSEERVRNRLGEFRKQVYEAAIQARIDAAEAAFSPSGDDTDRSRHAAIHPPAKAE